MRKELICDNCGLEEDDELYEYNGKQYCLDCLEEMNIITRVVTTEYHANHEWFSEGEFYEAIEHAGCKVIS